ncbi:translocation/assembly module TamB domain-containing protein [Megalodesulfovibrio paquesii]
MAMRITRRQMFWLLGGLTATPVVFALLVLLALQTSPVHRQLASLLATTLASENGTAEVRGLSGRLPFTLRLERFALSDAKGPWLEIDGLSLDWSPLALLRNRVRVAAVSAERIRLDHLPPPELKAEASEEPPSPLWPLPRLSLPEIFLDSLQVERLEFGETVLGQAAAFRVLGEATSDGDRVTARLDIPRIDGHNSTLNLQATADLAAWTLGLDARLQEAPGGLVASLVSLPGHMALGGALTGEGPLQDWRGVLAASADQETLLEGEVRLAVPERQDQDARANLTLTVLPLEHLLPADAPAQARAAIRTLGKAVQLTASVEAASDLSRIRIHELFLDAGPVTLRSDGNLTSDSLALDTTVAARDLAPLGLVAGQVLAGEFYAAVQLSGTPTRPVLTLYSQLKQASAPGLEVEALNINTQLAPLAPLDSPFTGVLAVGYCNATGLRLEGVPANIGPDLDAEWQVEADPGGGMQVRTFAVRDGTTVLSASGPINPAGRMDLALGLEGLSLRERLPELPLAGNVVLSARATGDLARQDIALNATLGLQALAARGPDLEPAARLLGASPTLTLAARMRNQTIDLDSLAFAGTGIGLEAAGGVDLAAGTLNAGMRMHVPDLAPLEPWAPWAGQPLRGECVLDLNATGALAAPTASLALEARHLSAPAMALKKVVLRADMQGGDPQFAAPAGSVSLALSGEQGDFALATRYRLTGQALQLQDLALRGPGASLAGSLDVDLANTLVNGSLKGGVTDLAPLGKTLGQSLAGNLQLSTNLSAAHGRQDVELTLDSSRLQAADLSLGRLRLAGSLRNVLQAPQGSLSLQVSALQAGGARVGSATVTARGDGGKIAFTVAAKDGDVGGAAVSADLAGDVTLLQGSQSGLDLTLSRLNAAYAGLPAKLLAPLKVSQRGESLEVKGLSLQAGPTRLTASLVKSPDKLNGEVAVAALDLARLAELPGLNEAEGFKGLRGQVQAKVGLAGSPGNPKVTLAATGTGLRMAGDPLLAELPALGLDVDATAVRDGLKATLRITGLEGSGKGSGQPVTLTASLPATFTLEPFAFSPKDGAMNAALTGGVNLARFSTMLEHFDARCRGLLTLDLAVSGSPANPQVRGGIKLEQGFVEALGTGTVLDPVTMDVRGSNTAITLTSLDIRDRSGGRLLATGSLRLDGDMPFEGKFAFKDFTPARHKLGTGKVSGDVAVGGRLSGAGKGGKAAGVLTIKPATVTLPTRLPPDVAPVDQLDIVHGNASVAQVQKARRTKNAGSAWPMELDIRILIPNSLRIHGLGLESQWNGDLTIAGQAAQPMLTGVVAVSRGGVDFLGKRFTLSKGEVGFGGDWPPDPLVSVEATTDAGDVTGILKLQGHADTLDLTLSSDPVLPREEVLSRILFGREMQNLSALQALQLAKAGRMLLTSSGTWDMLGSNDELLPGLTFGKGSKDSGDGEGGEPSAASKFLDRAWNSMRLDVRQPVGEQSNEIAVEVDITNDLMLHGTVDDRGQEGVGLQWKHDY